MQAREEFLSWERLNIKLNELSVAVDSNDAIAIRSLLMQLVSGYEPSGEVLDWVHTAIKL